MKTCPYCLEDVKDAAIKCPHCQSSLQPEASDRYVRYDIDKGVVGFGKFIVVIVGLLIFIGLAFYAMDLKRYLRKPPQPSLPADLAQIEAQRAQLDAQKAQMEAERSQIEAERFKSEAQANIKEIKSGGTI